MKSKQNTVSFLVYGDKAIFTDPITKNGGERHTYPVPTYEALRGVMESCYWKPTIRWVIDRVRVLTPIKKECVSLRLPKYSCATIDRSYNTYLTDVAYQVEAHFEWSNEPGFVADQNEKKHLSVANRSIARGGRYDIYLGSRECQAYLEPCTFGEGPGAYDHIPEASFGLMYHGMTYPNMTGENKLYSRFWECTMKNGVITFPTPEECETVRFVRDMKPCKRISYDPCAEEDVLDLPDPIPVEGIPDPAVLELAKQPAPLSNTPSWAAKLCETYDNLIALDKAMDEAGEEPLGLLYPSIKKMDAQYELTLDANGDLVPDSIRILPKEEAMTFVPCTMTSEVRVGGQKTPNLLFDFLIYLAADYGKYFDDNGSCHEDYMDNLTRWCNSEARHPFADIIHTYLSKGTLMADLDKAGVLPVSKVPEGAEAPLKWPASSGNSLVRFRIQMDGLDPEIWKNRSLWESANQFNELCTPEENKDICSVSGKKLTPIAIHPYLMGTCKLISSGDKTDFTYRFGVRDLPTDNVQISYEASQKLHKALRWLMSNQSFRVEQQTYLFWSTHNVEMPKLLLPGPSAPIEEESNGPDVSGRAYAECVRAYARGILQQIPENDEVVLMSIASPTTGRISVTEYETLSTSRFWDNLQHWYLSTAAKLPVQGGLEMRAPTPYEISDVTCGASKTQAEKESILRLILNSMILSNPIPRRIPQAMAANVVRMFSAGGVPTQYNPANNKTLNVAAGIIRKYLNDQENIGNGEYKEVWTISLDDNMNDRSYMLGRLLAYYYKLENTALYIANNGYRTTNAEKLMNQFYSRPSSVLGILENRMVPYRKRLEKVFFGRNFLAEIDAFVAKIPAEMLHDSSGLSESFILGYHAQLNAFNKKISVNNDKEDN